MNVVTSLGILAAFALLVPPIIILIYQLFYNRSLLSLAFYFLLSGMYNLMAVDIIPASVEVRQMVGIMNNYLDAPLMLLALRLFCTTARQRSILHTTLIAFIGYEVVVGITKGFTVPSLVYILGPGVAILFIYAVGFFVRYARIAIEKNKQLGKTLMLASITFAYGCYAMIYCFHYIQKTSARADVFLIYYIASVITSLIMAIGLLSVSRRGQKIKEVQTTRKELALFFNH